MSVEAVRWAFDQPLFPSTLKMVLVALAEYANKDKLLACPKIDTLAIKTSLNRATIFRHLTELLELGLITATGKTCGYYGRTKEYQVELNVKCLYNGPVTDPEVLVRRKERLKLMRKLRDQKSHRATMSVAPCDSRFSTHILLNRTRNHNNIIQSEIPLSLDPPAADPTITGTTDPVSQIETPKAPETPAKTPSKAMRIPTLEEVKFHAEKIGLPERQAQQFFCYYESNGWKVGGKAPMKNWVQALTGWKLRWEERTGGFGYNGNGNGGNGNGSTRSYAPINPVAVRIALENDLKRCEVEIESLRSAMQYDWDKTPERLAALKNLRAKRQNLLDQIAVVPLR